MPSAPAARRSVVRLLCALAVGASAVLAVAAPARAGTDPLAGRTITGQLLQAYPESAAEDREPAGKPLSWVQPADSGPVRLDTADLPGVPAGATVRVTLGRAIHDAAEGVGAAHDVTRSFVLAAGEPRAAADDTSVAAADDTTGPAGTPTSTTTSTTTRLRSAAGLTDRVAVVLVEAGGGAPDRTTAGQLTAAVDGEVHDFWSEQTGGAVDLGVVTTTDWVPTTAGCDTPTALWDQAAAAAGFVDGPGNHLLVYVSGASADAADCSYGLASIGDGLHDGGRLYVEDTLPSLIAHEIGHNFGLGHSSSKQCDAAVDTGRCRIEGYGDYYDVMGASWEHVGTLNAAQQAALGVLPAAQRRSLDARSGGSVTLAPLSAHSGVRALELSAAAGTDYWLEYRPATGRDAWLGTSADRLGLQAGVLLHRSGLQPDTSLLLDGTPSAAAGWDDDLQDALPLGTPVALAGGVTVTVTAQTSAAASISVTTTPTAAGAPAPAPVVLPSTAPRVAGQPCRGCPAGSPSAAPTPHPDAAIAPSAIRTPAHPVHPATGERLSLAALRSPTAWTALGALGGCSLLLGCGLLHRMRRRAVRRAGIREV